MAYGPQINVLLGFCECEHGSIALIFEFKRCIQGVKATAYSLDPVVIVAMALGRLQRLRRYQIHIRDRIEQKQLCIADLIIAFLVFGRTAGDYVKRNNTFYAVNE